MKRKLSLLLCILAISISAIACNQVEDEKITIVLDWTPNTNHTGLYVAEEKGYFEKLGLEVDIIQPPEGESTSLVASGKAQFGIDFQDMLAPAFTKDDPLPVTTVATIIQHNTSGVISLKASGMDTPKGMENKSYATWDLPVEQAIIKQVVESDGGDYDAIDMVPSTVNDVVTALKTDIDAVWVYYAWDGIATEVQGIETDFFAFKDIEPVLDYYNPIIVANNTYLEENEKQAKAFLEAVAKGYEYAIDNPEDAANILVEANPELDIDIALESQKWLVDEYKAEVEQWGYIDSERWDDFYKWLWDEELIEQEIPEGFGFTNEYLQE